MSPSEDPRPAQPGPDEETHLQVHASGDARVHQAGRDQHIHYVDGVRDQRRTVPGALVRECPYPGLTAFGPEQARWFFGRDGLIAELIARVDRRVRAGGVQVVVGPSGAGKSSLLRAGLLPALDRAALPGSDRWPKLMFTPTAEPLRVLAGQIALLTGADVVTVVEELAADPVRCLSRLSHAPHGPNGDRGPQVRVVVVVDQFEELFTLCTDDRQRHTFIDLLLQLAGSRADSGTEPVGLVVVGVRADFYAACADHPRLRTALQDAPLVVGSMSDPELREAILHPARDVGLDIEPGLVEVLLHDLGATTRTDGFASYGAGRLPLLAHALRASWQQRHGATLTVDGYRDTGGIQHAIATSAEQVYASLDDAGRGVARSLFLRLIKIGEGTEDTRRRVSRTELMATSAEAPRAAVVDAFTQARLLTQQRDTVEITHEALLRSWPRLRGWIDTDRDGRLAHQNLEETAAAWERSHRDPSLLYRGSHLEVAGTLTTAARPCDLSPVAHGFLAASTRARRRTARLRTGTIVVLAVLTLTASAAAVVAYRQQGEALRQRDLAIYNRVLAEADQLRGTDVSLSAQLTLVAHRMRPDDETYTRLVTAGNAALSTPLTGHTGTVQSVAFSRDGRILATASGDKSVRLWNLSDPTRPVTLAQPLTGHKNTVNSVMFSPDGRILATGSSDKSVRLWNLSDPTRPVTLAQPLTGHKNTVLAVAFSPDGRTLATASGDKSVRLWDLSDPTRPAPLGQPLTGHSDFVHSVAFSPDGRTLATGSRDFTVRLWNLSDPTRPAPLGQPLIGHSDFVHSVAFSPDGRTLASVSGDKSVRLWNLSDPTRPTPLAQPLEGHTGDVRSVAFSPDGRTLATGSQDATVRLWNVADPARPTSMAKPLTGHTDALYSVAFSPDGHTLATGSGDQSIQLWRMNVGEDIDRICAVTRNTLTAQEWQRHVGDDVPYNPPCE